MTTPFQWPDYAVDAATDLLTDFEGFCTTDRDQARKALSAALAAMVERGDAECFEVIFETPTIILRESKP